MKVLARSFVALALAGALSAPMAPVAAAPGGAAGGSGGSSGGPPQGQSSLGHVGSVVESETETDLATGIVTTYTETEEYDNRGRLVHYVEEEVRDGVVQWRYESTAQFGPDGTETIVTVGDGDGDGPAPADLVVSTLVYGKRGLLIAADTTYDYGSDGTIEARDHEVFTRDRQGRELTVHLELGVSTGGAGLVVDVTYTYDKHGNVIRSTEVTDFLDTPQSPDEEIVITSEWDSRRNFLSGVTESYTYDAQGDATLTDRETFESTYGKSGLRIAEHSTRDSDGDGTVDAVSDTVLRYDRKRRVTSSVQTIVDGSTTVVTDLDTYDRRGNNVRHVSSETRDGQLEYRRVELNTFDRRGRFTSYTESEDLDGDGGFDAVLHQVVMGYDGRGRVTSFVTTEEDGGGTVLARHEVSIEWFKYYQVRTSFHDDDGDGTWDTKLVRVVSLVFG